MEDYMSTTNTSAGDATFRVLLKVVGFLFKFTFGLLFKGIKALVRLISGKGKQKPITQETEEPQK
jgi:hypothetical protein